MKHTWKVTLVLIVLFLAAHFIGLFIIKHYLPQAQALPFNIEKPKIEEGISYIPIFISIIIATVLALVLARFQAMRLWKLWFFLSVLFTLTISFNAFVSQWAAFGLALLFAIVKVFKPNPIVHNFSELFIYGGLAAVFVPILNFKSISILLVVISVYDMIAVWKTKHMVSLAQFQSKSRLFAGLFIPYGRRAEARQPKKGVIIKKMVVVENQAVLGGGDIGFSLLFSGVVLSSYGFAAAFIVSGVSALALLGLFMVAEKKKFYPAMPFITFGCFIGYAVVRFLF